jgi:hypothetical protein
MPKTPDAVATPQAYQQHHGAPGASADGGVWTHLLNHAPRKHVPTEWEGDAGNCPQQQRLTVDLGGERVRVVVRRVVTLDKVLVELDKLPASRNHAFKHGDFVACERKATPFGEVWEAARYPADAGTIAELERERAERLAAEEAAKRGAAPAKRRERRKVT